MFTLDYGVWWHKTTRMTGLRKATATPDEWERHLAYHRERRWAKVEKERARMREYHLRPEVKERRRLYDARPAVLAKKRAKAQTSEAKAKAAERFQQRCKEDPDLLVRRAAYGRKLRTGFDEGLVSTLLVRQDNRCGVCGISFDRRTACADHCHTTGKPRGLLCSRCNIIEGMMKGVGLGVVEYAHRLVAYLEKPPASTY